MRITPALPSIAALALTFGCSSGGGGNTTTSSGGSGGGGTTTTSADPSVVETDHGKVQGVITAGTRAFLGVPFAAPPVGALRWKAPAPAAAWGDIKDATKKGLPCPQLDSLTGKPKAAASEDCLHLNVWTPEKASGAPVMVWIHGGGFTIGSGGEITYDGAALSAATGAVVVTLNYRLGPLGFLAHPALTSEDAGHPSSGMYGFEDQRAALSWVKDNAAAFGGDPERITLFGESAGAISTCLHLLSPKSQGLFHRAVVQSGACSLAGGTQASAELQGGDLAAAVGCADPPKALECLRGKPPEELLLALPEKPGEIGPGGAAWVPIVDGYNMPEQPAALLASGSFTKVPTILGTNADEGTIFFFIGLSAKDETEYLDLMSGIWPGHGADIVARYPAATFGSARAAAIAAIGDGMFVCPGRRTARALAAAGASVYRYDFRHAPKALIPDLGAFHSAEVPFIFGNPYLGIVLDEEEQKLQAAMRGYWARLAASGDPNNGGAPAWPSYEEATHEHLALDLAISTESGLKESECDFWDPIGP